MGAAKRLAQVGECLGAQMQDYFEKLEEWTRPKGYVVWVDYAEKWHSTETSTGQGGEEISDDLLDEHSAKEVWIVENPKRYQSLKIAKQDYKERAMPPPIRNKLERRRNED